MRPSEQLALPLQYWTKETPCTHCGGTSNTTHSVSCRNYGLFDWQGNAVPEVPYFDRDPCPARHPETGNGCLVPISEHRGRRHRASGIHRQEWTDNKVEEG